MTGVVRTVDKDPFAVGRANAPTQMRRNPPIHSLEALLIAHPRPAFDDGPAFYPPPRRRFWLRLTLWVGVPLLALVWAMDYHRFANLQAFPDSGDLAYDYDWMWDQPGLWFCDTHFYFENAGGARGWQLRHVYMDGSANGPATFAKRFGADAGVRLRRALDHLEASSPWWRSRLYHDDVMNAIGWCRGDRTRIFFPDSVPR